MRATVLHSPGDIRLDTLPDPDIEADTDAIVRVVAACVCGSDLWPYRGLNKPQTEAHQIGHEQVGIVERVGTDVSGISVGWADLYDYTIDFQWIDVTGLPSGQYWLESVADPDDRLLETDETNNAARALVNLDVPRLADATGDGLVTHADFMTLYNHFGQSNRTWSQGDFTGDNKVDFTDFQVLETQFNRPAPPPTPTLAPARSANTLFRPAGRVFA